MKITYSDLRNNANFVREVMHEYYCAIGIDYRFYQFEDNFKFESVEDESKFIEEYVFVVICTNNPMCDVSVYFANDCDEITCIGSKLTNKILWD